MAVGSRAPSARPARDVQVSLRESLGAGEQKEWEEEMRGAPSGKYGRRLVLPHTAPTLGPSPGL